jgi:FecR protein
MKKQHFVRGPQRARVRRGGVVILGLTMLALMALFAPVRAVADDDDPPTRVARLSYVNGAVSFQPGGTEDWVEATLNRPVTTGDKIWADRDSRAELHIGSASLRISSNTGFSFLNLSDNVTQVQLTAGDLRLRVKRLDPNESLEIDTPNLAFSVLRPGVYRISVNDAGDTTVIKVRSGEGEVTGGGGAYTVRPQEVGSFFGTEQLDADIQRYHGRDDDDFDEWCSERDRRPLRLARRDRL